MKQNYKKLGEIVELIDERNKSLVSTEVLGISIDKEFMPSVANTIGTDLSNYKLISKNIFACNPMVSVNSPLVTKKSLCITIPER